MGNNPFMFETTNQMSCAQQEIARTMAISLGNGHHRQAHRLQGHGEFPREGCWLCFFCSKISKVQHAHN